MMFRMHNFGLKTETLNTEYNSCTNFWIRNTSYDAIHFKHWKNTIKWCARYTIKCIIMHCVIAIWNHSYMFWRIVPHNHAHFKWLLLLSFGYWAIALVCWHSIQYFWFKRNVMRTYTYYYYLRGWMAEEKTLVTWFDLMNKYIHSAIFDLKWFRLSTNIRLRFHVFLIIYNSVIQNHIFSPKCNLPSLESSIGFYFNQVQYYK